jgi:hypothetical protein
MGSSMPDPSSLSGRVQSQALTLLVNVVVQCKQVDCVVHVKTLLGEGVGERYLSLPVTKVNKKTTHSFFAVERVK